MLQKIDRRRQADQGDFSFAQFFEGRTLATGVVENRFGTAKRSFTATLEGKWHNDTFQLFERFVFCNGQIEDRLWNLHFDETGSFVSHCADTVGQGRGRPSGTGCRHSYIFRLPIGGRSITLRINEAYHAVGWESLIYRARMNKWGLRVGTIFISFRKP